MSRSLYDILREVYMIKRADTGDPTSPPENPAGSPAGGQSGNANVIPIPVQLLRTLVGLAIGGYVGQQWAREDEDETLKLLKLLGLSGTGAALGYGYEDIVNSLAPPSSAQKK